MFLGEFSHSLDTKGRLILPARFRDQLAEGAFLSTEIDGCLALWTPEDFEERATDMQRRMKGGPMDRNVARAFFSGVAEAKPDTQGRVAIPSNLREFASLGRDVSVVGVYDHIEVWDATTWRDKKRSGELSLAQGEQTAVAEHHQ